MFWKEVRSDSLEGNGSEAVVPLEKNTGWLDQIALRLAKLNPSSSDGGVCPEVGCYYYSASRNGRNESN